MVGCIHTLSWYYLIKLISVSRMRFFFFFQAEDGIRDRNVTGVQTCALPISVIAFPAGCTANAITGSCCSSICATITASRRSEERRVGKSVDLGGRRIIKKKKRKE